MQIYVALCIFLLLFHLSYAFHMHKVNVNKDGGITMSFCTCYSLEGMFWSQAPEYFLSLVFTFSDTVI